ncbi:uncharacterized protein LOC110859836 isoform X2 [Folsomia candida]|uniref:uncharacterized protein LOC110859836 isoform X2 n=1 Tax=Folsomia candida TaxID=158441 RepID=UPI000B904C92|nr:uncharacterized protein LOC110859836 isoform X2 [Folsomia candida]
MCSLSRTMMQIANSIPFAVFLLLLSISPLLCFPVEPIDWNYPQAPLDSEPQIKLRKHLCPPGKTSSSFRYHTATKDCYKLGEKGPCGQNMVWHSDVNSTVFGECDCDFLNSRIPLVYHPASDRCYHIFTQAYCEPNQWVTFSDFDPTCVRDKCDDVIFFDADDSSDGAIVEFNNKCVQLNSKNPACKPDEIVTFVADQVHPTCGRIGDGEEFSVSLHSVFKTRTLSCKPGSRRDVHGKCRRTITIKPSSAPSSE